MRRKRKGKTGLVLSMVVFFGMLLMFAVGMRWIDNGASQRQKEILEKALNRDVVYCYSVEGRYPESLSYIEEHYGLVYDTAAFFVDYSIQGSNIYPDITIIEK